MPTDAITQMVGSLGFPIACCVALFYYQYKVMDKFTASVNQSLKELSDTISKNTEATVELVTTVEVLNKIGSDANGQRRPAISG